ncbi:MAG: MarR family transcriptional regulator [Polaromonas sp.]|jgi:DNA-binding MarR family transcriptional regulator|nr:MarR family transcriptional regulator [Polaromonas sp.]
MLKKSMALALDDNLDDAIGFLIAETSRHVRRSLYARIAEHDVRGGSWYPLRVLWQRDGLTQREIADRLGITEPSVQEMIRAMEKDGLVERRRDEADKRKIHIHLSPHARKLRKPLLAISDEVNQIAMSGLTPGDQQLLKLLLKRVKISLAEDFRELNGMQKAKTILNFKDEARGATVKTKK